MKLPTMVKFDFRTVSNCRLFEELSDETLKEVISDSCVICHSKNHPLFLRHSPVEYIYIILDGWVKTYHETLSGQEVVIDFMNKGDSIGESALFTERTHRNSAQTVTNVRLLRIPAKSLIYHMSKRPEVALCFLSYISNRLHESSNEIKLLKTQNGMQRVADFLLHLYRIEDGSPVLALPFEKALIARKLGMQPESFSRILSKLGEYGISTKADKILVSDITSLQSVCDNSIDTRQVA